MGKNKIILKNFVLQRHKILWKKNILKNDSSFWVNECLSIKESPVIINNNVEYINDKYFVLIIKTINCCAVASL